MACWEGSFYSQVVGFFFGFGWESPYFFLFIPVYQLFPNACSGLLSFTPSGVLEECCIDGCCGQLHIADDRSTNEAVLDSELLYCHLFIFSKEQKSC